MDRRERERIMREGGVGAQNPLDDARAQVLAEDLAESRLSGRPLRQRLRNFRPAVDTYVVSLGGVPAYMRRLREIEDETEDHRRALEDAWFAIAEACAGDPASFALQWDERAAAWNFSSVNRLIERHNEYYPVEARLPMDPRTGDFVLVAGGPYRRRPLDRDWILRQFPPDLASATASVAFAQ